MKLKEVRLGLALAVALAFLASLFSIVALEYTVVNTDGLNVMFTVEDSTGATNVSFFGQQYQVWANYSNSTSGVAVQSSCTVFIDGSPQTTVMIDGFHTANTSALSSGIHLVNVTCQNVTQGYDLVSYEWNITVANANVSARDVEDDGFIAIIHEPTQINASFRNVTNNEPIAGGACNLTVQSQTVFLVEQGNQYVANITFVQNGTYEYQVSCFKENFVTSNATGTLTVHAMFSDAGFPLTERSGSSVLFLENGSFFYTGYLLTGFVNASTNAFLPIILNAPAIEFGSMAYGPFVNNTLYFLIAGRNSESETDFTALNLDTQEQESLGIAGVMYASTLLFDIDADGYNDVISIGTSDELVTGAQTTFYSGRTLEQRILPVPDYYRGSLCLFTLDNNVGIIFAGRTGPTNDPNITALLYNTSLQDFEELNIIGAGDPLISPSCASGDLDGDGNIDVLLQGYDENGGTFGFYFLHANNSALYVNPDIFDGSVFVSLADFNDRKGTLVIADINNDGHLDIVSGGYDQDEDARALYLYLRNTSDTSSISFIRSESLVDYGFTDGDLALYDYDTDGDVDLLFSGTTDSALRNTVLLNNSFSLLRQNQPPTPPQSINASFERTDGELGTLSIAWSEGADDTTPTQTLTYHVKVTNRAGDTTHIAGERAISSNPANGYMGNALNRRNMTFYNITADEFEIAVKTIDASYRESAWSESVFVEYDGCVIPELPTWYVNATTCQKNGSILITDPLEIIIQAPGRLYLYNVTLTTTAPLTITIENGILDLRNSSLSGDDIVIMNNKTLLVRNSSFTNTTFLINASTTVNTSVFAMSLFEVNDSLNITSSSLSDTPIVFHHNVTFKNTTDDTQDYTFSEHTFLFTVYDILFSAIDEGGAITASVVLNDSTATTENTFLTPSTIPAIYSRQNSSGITILSNHTAAFNYSTHYAQNISFNASQTSTVSATLNRTAVPSHNFSPSLTTDFQAFYTGNITQDIVLFTNLSNVTLGVEDIGLISFTSPVDVFQLNLSNHVTFSLGAVSNNASGLNASATITLFDLSYVYQPVVLRDDAVCQACENFTYDGQNFTFDVPSWSAYRAEQNSYGAFDSAPAAVEEVLFNITFVYANRTNTSSAIAGSCDLAITDTMTIIHSDTLTQDVDGLFKRQINFSDLGMDADTQEYEFFVNCSADDFESLNITQSFSLYPGGLYFAPRGSFPGLSYASAVTGDFTGNGINDIIYSGVDASDVVKLYVITDATTSQIKTSYRIVRGSLLAYDFTNQGRLDIIALGSTDREINNQRILYISNVHATPTVSTIGTLNFWKGSLSLLDYNLDGMMDFVLCGQTEDTVKTTLYLNSKSSPGTFTEHTVGLDNIGAEGDNCNILSYPTAGVNTILVSGQNSSNDPHAQLFTRYADGTVFNRSYAGVFDGAATLFHYGSSPLALFSGRSSSSTTATLQINMSSNQTVALGLPAVYFSTAATGDLTLNGKQDLYISGYNGSVVSTIFLQDNILQENQTVTDYLEPVLYGSIQFFDMDNDGDLDVFMAGSRNRFITIQENLFARVYENTISYTVTNPGPSQVENVTAFYNDTSGMLRLSWSPATHATSQPLYYNVRIGHDNNVNRYRSGVLGSSSNPSAQLVGAYFNTTELLFNLSRQDCKRVQVQAIDLAHKTGAWSDIVYVNKTTEVVGNAIDENCDGIATPSVTTGGGGAGGAGGGAGGSGGNPPPIPPPVQPQQPQEPQTSPPSSNSGSSDDEQTQSQIDPFDQVIPSYLSSRVIRVDRTITYYQNKAVITEKINNILPINYDLHGVNITITVPKDVASSMRDIVCLDSCIVIEDDPVFAFQDIILRHRQAQYFRYEIATSAQDLHTRLLTDIQVPALSEEAQARLLLAYDNGNAIIATTTVTPDYEKNTTTVDVGLTFNATDVVLENVDIYQEIPKCLLAYIQQLEKDTLIRSDLYYEVIEEDPVIRFHFDKLYPDQKIRYQIQSVADQDCLDQINTVTLAETFHAIQANYTMSQILLPLGITVLVAAIFLFIGSFTTHKHTDDLKEQQVIPLVKRMLRRKMSHEEIRKALQSYGKKTVDTTIDLITRHKLRYFFNTVVHGFALYIAILLIILAITDIAEIAILQGDALYVKIIINWVLMIYVFYHVSVTQVLVGRKHQHIDKLILLGFFALTLKNLVAYARASYGDAHYVRPLFSFILKHNAQIEMISFLCGLVLLTLVTLYLTYRYHIGRKSMYNAVFHEDAIVDRHTRLQRFWRIYVVLLLFFAWVFAPLFEWLAVAVDAPLITLLLGITAVSFIYHRFKKDRQEPITHVISDVTEKPDTAYEHLIELFHYPRTILLGLAGILVITLLTEIGIYLIPYLIGTNNPVYFQVTNDARALTHSPLFFGHDPIVPFITQGAPLYYTILMYCTYLVSWLGILLILLIPAWVWFHAYKHRHKPLTKETILDTFVHDGSNVALRHLGRFILIFSLPFFLVTVLSGSFGVEAITYGQLYGVDILTHRIEPDKLVHFGEIAMPYASVLLVIAGIFGLLALLAAMRRPREYTAVVLLVSAVTLVCYNAMFIYSLYITTFTAITSFTEFTLLFFAVFIYWVYFQLAALIGFYVVGFTSLLFIYLPTSWKYAVLGWKPLSMLRNHLLLPHIHFHHVHNEHLHGPDIARIKHYIAEAVEHGHDPFVVLEHLYHKGWPVVKIEQAIFDLGHDAHFIHALHHVKTKHADAKRLHTLEMFVRKIPKDKRNDVLVDALLKKGWLETDIEIVMARVRLPVNEHRLLQMAREIEVAERKDDG